MLMHFFSGQNDQNIHLFSCFLTAQRIFVPFKNDTSHLKRGESIF